MRISYCNSHPSSGSNIQAGSVQLGLSLLKTMAQYADLNKPHYYDTDRFRASRIHALINYIERTLLPFVVEQENLNTGASHPK